MLGYTLADCERLHDEAAGDVPYYYDTPQLTYAEYAAALMAHIDSAPRFAVQSPYGCVEVVGYGDEGEKGDGVR